MRKNKKYLLKHLSIRVPWHDNKWSGTVCKNPIANGACLILKNCAQNRNDQLEASLAGKSLKDIEDSDHFPVCVGERGTFMSPFPFARKITHPYVSYSPTTHGHLKETILRFPPFSAAAVPYRWMLRENTDELTSLYSLNFNLDQEPPIKWKDDWIQELNNQKTMLNCFFEHVEEEKSLAFFYAKRVPFVEDSGRVLIGVARINKIIDSPEYDMDIKKGEMKCCLWEHMILHSLREDNKDGFLLPYHEALEYQKKYPDFDPASIAVMAPTDKILEFSYATEHVSSDTAIRTLLRCINSLEIAKEKGIGANHDASIQWLHDRIQELEKLRGDYPGFGSALCAMGIEKGHFIAAEIVNKMKEGDDAWKLFEEAIIRPPGILSKEVFSLIPKNTRDVFKLLNEKKTERLNLLYMLSRFDLSQDQAKMFFVEEERESVGIDAMDKNIIENPYLIYECSIHTVTPVDLATIDLGIFLNLNKKLAPESFNFNDPLDNRRIRALVVQQLESATFGGHTLLPRKTIIKNIRDLQLIPKCDINSDYLDLAETIFEKVIDVVKMKDESPAYQLHRLSNAAEIIRSKIIKRQQASRLSIKADWGKIVNDEFNKITSDKPDEAELKAREEKAAALKELAESRFSVLIGPAGTGKTTLLTLLASHPEINKGGVVFLAPTGKARVRMSGNARQIGIQAYTLAQFLNQYKRYKGQTQRYVLSDRYCEENYETVVIDESSMLTEEMLATVFDCFKGIKRFILVGDHRQLPPIGAGRPFVDVINYLKPENIETIFPKVDKCYAELTIRRRQGGIRRNDLRLAEWFSGGHIEPGEDSIINEIIKNKDSDNLRMINWQEESDFDKIIEKALIEELKLETIEDLKSFNISLGSTADGKYFNWKEAVEKVEGWQILSPVKEKPFGIRSINRKIHKLFRSQIIDYSYQPFNKLFYPFGNEEIVYGDKVINLYNQNRKKEKVYPNNGLNYVANGEIGIVVGQLKAKYHTFKGKPKNMEIELTSQKGFKYTFNSWEFGDEGQPPLELAYAITVHKAQGSEFKKVFLVIPNPCFLLKREMLYTALTRQIDKVVVLYQGDIFKIKEISSDEHSDTYSRITNLFIAPDMVEVKGKYLENHLIHLASDNTLLRSKSELLIYQRLLDKNLNPRYEIPLEIKEVMILPDFTIEDDDAGITYYWEHCGVLNNPEYQKRWDEKLRWYTENNILPIEDGGGSNGTLIVTTDKPVQVANEIKGAFSIKEVDEIILKVFKI